MALENSVHPTPIENSIHIQYVDSDSDLPYVERGILDIKDFFPYLRGERFGWKKEVSKRMHDLMDVGLQGFGLGVGDPCTITFHSSRETIKKHILMAILPIYIGNSIHNSDMRELKPPLVPLSEFSDSIEKLNKMLNSKGPCYTSFIDVTCNRFAIVHSDVDKLANWLWTTLGCFDLSVVSEICILEECKE